MDARVVRSCSIVVGLSSHKIILHGLAERHLEHEHIDQSLSKSLYTGVVICLYQSHMIGCLFTALCCAVLCTPSLTLKRTFCLVVAACTSFAFLIAFYSWIRKSRVPMHLDHHWITCSAQRTTYATGLAPPSPDFEAFEWGDTGENDFSRSGLPVYYINSPIPDTKVHSYKSCNTVRITRWMKSHRPPFYLSGLLYRAKPKRSK